VQRIFNLALSIAHWNQTHPAQRKLVAHGISWCSDRITGEVFGGTSLTVSASVVSRGAKPVETSVAQCNTLQSGSIQQTVLKLQSSKTGAKQVFCLGCYDRDFEYLGEFTKIEGRNKMKITVNGGNGFIGSKLATSLREDGHKVVSVQSEAGTNSKPMVALAFLITSTLITASTLIAQKAVTPPTAHETITPLITKDLAGLPGEQVLMYTVDFPPGFSSPIHRHNAQVSVYVMEGSVVMQVRGGKEMTLTPGQSFYEDPNDIHVVSRNASSTKPAKFLVFLINKKGAPLVIPAK